MAPNTRLLPPARARSRWCPAIAALLVPPGAAAQEGAGAFQATTDVTSQVVVAVVIVAVFSPSRPRCRR